MERKEIISSRLKLLGLFIFLIGLWVLNLILPIRVDSYPLGANAYVLRLNSIFYVMVTIFSIYIIIAKKSHIKLNYIVVGTILGTLAGLTITSTSAFGINYTTALVTVLSYIASMLMFHNSEVKMILFKKLTFDGLVALIIVLVILVGVLCLNSGVLVVLRAFIKTLQPGISEEVIFRMFLFALSTFIIGGKFKNYAYSKILIYLALIIPFAIYHYGDNILNKLPAVPMMIIVATILTFSAIKHSLFSAIVVHILINLVNYSLLLQYR